MTTPHREDALYSYVTTVMTDPRVLAAVSAQAPEQFSMAVFACIREDMDGVWRRLLQNGARAVLRRAAPVAHGFLDALAGFAERTIADLNKTVPRGPRR